MDEFTADAFVNRDEPIPVRGYDAREDLSNDEAEPEPGRRRDRLWSYGGNFKEKLGKVKGKAAESGTSMQDRLLEKLLAQVIPTEETPAEPESTPSKDTTTRPSFSLPTMSNNFRRFNARIGVVFVFQSNMLKLFSWRKPTHTLSFLAVYTFVCLDPYILSVLPLALLLLALLIPSFIARHPAPPPTITASSHMAPIGYSTAGPPLAPAPTVKPVKELSKDFFRNMRDLQNSMEDFSRVHDHILSILVPPTNFSDEPLSSTIFLFAFLSCLLMFIGSHLLPWRIIFLLTGWAAIISSHPTVQRQLASTHQKHIVPLEQQSKSYLDAWIASDIILDSAPEIREVEIFELQRLSDAGEWENWLFSSSPFDPLSHDRLVVGRPRGTRFFEDVKPPAGWEWSEKKWALDLWSREWVEERIITGVEVETEGERWVYDIRYEYEEYPDVGTSSRQSIDGRSSLDLSNGNGNGNGNSSSSGTASNGNGNGKGKKKVLPSWEEWDDAESEGRGRRGEWRRRRWVRLVKRTYVARIESEGVVGGVGRKISGSFGIM